MEPVFCPICLSEDTKVYHDRVWHMEGGAVLQCRFCEAAFLHPMMNDEEERLFYEAYNAHVQARGVTLSSTPEEFHQKSQPIARERFEVIGEWYVPGMKVLEMGSSTGAFLELLMGCECSCVEPAHDNREFSKQFVNAAFTDIADVPRFQQFDVICMFHVFEHIRNPVDFLISCKQLLRNAGHVIVEVPCIHDPLLTIYDLDVFKDFYFQPMHPFIYSEKALDICFDKAGLRKITAISHQRYGLDNHLAWLKNRQPGGDDNLRRLFADNGEYKKKLAELKMTDTLFYIGAHSN